jgi:hypothetical protein
MHHELYIRTSGVDHDIGNFAIKGIAQATELLQPLARIGSLQQRPVLVVTRALQNILHAGAQVHHRAACIQVGSVLRIENRPAAGSQHDALLRRQVANHFRFPPAETFLPFDFKNPRNRCTGTRFDLMVGINETLVQFLGQSASDSGFAGAHQADEKNIFGSHF